MENVTLESLFDIMDHTTNVEVMDAQSHRVFIGTISEYYNEYDGYSENIVNATKGVDVLDSYMGVKMLHIRLNKNIADMAFGRTQENRIKQIKKALADLGIKSHTYKLTNVRQNEGYMRVEKSYEKWCKKHGGPVPHATIARDENNGVAYLYLRNVSDIRGVLDYLDDNLDMETQNVWDDIPKIYYKG